MKYIQIKYSYRLIIIIFILTYSPGCDWSKQESVLHIEYTDTLFTVKQLIISAEELADKPPKTIKKRTQFKNNRFGGRAYVSLACYWWPNPNSEDGLPYIRKDGKINPETRTTKSDLPSMIEMARRVEILAVAYYHSGNEKFAESAIGQIESWFLDEQTAMLPHLEHAQMVKGQNNGRSYGIIDTWWMVRVVDSLPYLRHSEKWTTEMETGISSWFTHYLNWLLNSEFGQDEKSSSNNHGTWYDVQILTFARFTGQNELAKQHLKSVTLQRMYRQIAFTGRQKFEMRRSRPVHYSIYNLYGWIRLAQYGRELGVDLANERSFLNAGLHQAVHYLIRQAQNTDFDHILDPFDQTDTDRLYLELLLRAHEIYRDASFWDEIMRIVQHVELSELAYY